MQIRRARPADAPALSLLAFRAKAHWGYPEAWLDAWRGDLTLTADYLSARDTFVAGDSEGLLGVCVLERRRESASIEHLWIAPESHRRGVGRALVMRALETAAEAGLARVEVISDPFAEPFYLRLGARRVGDVPAPMPGAEDRALPLLEFVLSPGDAAA